MRPKNVATEVIRRPRGLLQRIAASLLCPLASILHRPAEQARFIFPLAVPDVAKQPENSGGKQHQTRGFRDWGFRDGIDNVGPHSAKQIIGPNDAVPQPGNHGLAFHSAVGVHKREFPLVRRVVECDTGQGEKMTEPHRGDTNFNILTSLQFLCKEGQGRWRVVLHKTRLSSPAPRESNLRGIRGDALVYRLDIRPYAKDEVSIVVPVSLELFMNVAPLRLFATVVSCSTVGCLPGGCGTRGVGYVPGNMF